MKTLLAIAASALLLAACASQPFDCNQMKPTQESSDLYIAGWLLKCPSGKSYTEKKIQVRERGKPTRTIYVREY